MEEAEEHWKYFPSKGPWFGTTSSGAGHVKADAQRKLNSAKHEACMKHA